MWVAMKGKRKSTLTISCPHTLSENCSHFNPYIPDSAKSKTVTFSKITNWGKYNANEWSHFRVLYMESKVRKLCITQGFTLGVKGLTNSTTVKYCSTAFQ